MDRHKFLNRKQKDDESLGQFWHALNGLAANYDFGTQTTGLVYDIFVTNMKSTLGPTEIVYGAEGRRRKRWNLRLLLSKERNGKKQLSKRQILKKNQDLQ